MKFTVIAIIPGLAAVNWFVWVNHHHSHSLDQTGPVAVITIAIWICTLFELAVYWGARIVRAVIGRR